MISRGQSYTARDYGLITRRNKFLSKMSLNREHRRVLIRPKRYDRLGLTDHGGVMDPGGRRLGPFPIDIIKDGHVIPSSPVIEHPISVGVPTGTAVPTSVNSANILRPESLEKIKIKIDQGLLRNRQTLREQGGVEPLGRKSPVYLIDPPSEKKPEILPHEPKIKLSVNNPSLPQASPKRGPAPEPRETHPPYNKNKSIDLAVHNKVPLGDATSASFYEKLLKPFVDFHAKNPQLVTHVKGLAEAGLQFTKTGISQPMFAN